MKAVCEEAGDAKNSPEFTDEEVHLIRLWSLCDSSAGGQLSAQIAYFATPAVFGIYGLLAGSLVIVGVAFVCILLLLGWGFVSTWRDQSKFGLIKSICVKVLAMLPADERRR